MSDEKRSVCIIPNCRKPTARAEPFCAEHRDNPSWERKYNAAMNNWSVEVAALRAELSAAKAENERLRGELRFADAAIAQWKSNANVEAEDRFALAEKLKGATEIARRLSQWAKLTPTERGVLIHDAVRFHMQSLSATQSALAGEKKL